MAYYTPNNNFGIPTLDLNEFGLTQPQENMQVAEAINYNTLPGAKDKFTPDFDFIERSNTDVKNYKGTTKGDYINAVINGQLGNTGGGTSFDRNVGDLFKGVNLDAKGYNPFSNVTPTFQYLGDGTGRGNIDIDKGALSDDALQSLPKGFFQNVGDQSSLVGPGGYSMTAMAMDPNRMTDAGYPGFFSQGDAISRTNVQGMDNEADLGAFMNPNIQPSQNIFQRAGNFVKDLELEEYLPFIGERSLTGMLGRGIGNLFQNIAPARYGTSQRAYNALTPQGRSAVAGIYGPNGIMSGYNAVSAFGRGPMGAIDNRIGNIYNRRVPQNDASEKKIQDLYKAREKIMQTTLDSDNRYTGPKAAPRGQKPGVMDDDPFGGTSGTTGGSSKIVCTMMNDSYGFGNFRNKIWLKHSKDLPKEYEVGYHKIFLPLVKFAKGEGKLNKVVKKTLEHIARHRTLDLKQEMKGKTHILGRVYRKILEPICFLVGKASMFVRRK